jgi:hypothetical protein
MDSVLNLLFEIRLISGSPVVVLTIKNETTDTNLHLNLEKINKHIHKIQQQKFNTITLTHNNITIYLDPPLFSDIINQNNLIFSCIKKINFDNYTINFDEINTIDKNTLIENLPLKTYNFFFKKINKILKEAQTDDLLKHYNISNLNLPFVFNIKCLTTIIQLLFYENLTNVYQNIFALCKYVSLTPEYIENMSIGEFHLYTKMLENMLSMIQQSSKKQDTIPLRSTPFAEF